MSSQLDWSDRISIDAALNELHRLGGTPADVEKIRATLALPVERNPLMAAWRAVWGDDAPYQDPWYHVSAPGFIHMIRHPLVVNYAWAVPSPEALDLIANTAEGRGVLEVGAGNGYWARLLAERGIDIIASDSKGRYGNHHVAGNEPFHPIRLQEARFLAEHYPDRVLLIVWPTYYDPWAGYAVEAYHQAGGHTVIYVGEGSGGCTGDDHLHELLGDPYDNDEPAQPLFKAVTIEPVPQWFGIHDRLHICERIA